jgi:hypothetical protein
MYQNEAKLVYADGEVFSPPVILTTSNGWVYKPDELRSDDDIRLGRNKSFPRSGGDYEARAYVEKVLTEHHAARDFEKPVSSTIFNTYPERPWGDQMMVSFWDEVFGWITLSLDIDERKDAGNDVGLYDVTYSVMGSKLLGWLSSKKVDHQRGGAVQNVVKNYQTIQPHVKEFMENPWIAVTMVENEFGHISYDGLLDQPDFEDLAFPKDVQWSAVEDDYDPYSASSGNALFYRKGVIEEIFESESNWKSVEHFFSALKFVGFEMRATWSYGSRGYNDKTLSGLQITIPKQGNELGHTISIQAHNPHVSVDCGFEQEEGRWVDRQQRKAVEQMADLEKELKTFDYTIEL